MKDYFLRNMEENVDNETFYTSRNPAFSGRQTFTPVFPE